MAVFLQHFQVPPKSDGEIPLSSPWKLDNGGCIGCVETWEFDVNNRGFQMCCNGATVKRCKVVLLLTASKMDAKELAKAMNCCQALCLSMPLRPLDLRQTSENTNLKIKPGKKSIECQQKPEDPKGPHGLFNSFYVGHVRSGWEPCFFKVPQPLARLFSFSNDTTWPRLLVYILERPGTRFLPGTCLFPQDQTNNRTTNELLPYAGASSF